MYDTLNGLTVSLNDSVTLTSRRAWYSHDLGDLIIDTARSPYGSQTKKNVKSTHIRNQKGYELTNHLGNVQATVLDRTSPLIDTNNNDELTGYHANISTAQDYYPFGMYMPGRYLSDTARHCVTMNSLVLVPKPLKATASTSSSMAMAYQIGGSPTPPLIGQLPKASNFKEEDIFHFLLVQKVEQKDSRKKRRPFSGGVSDEAMVLL